MEKTEQKKVRASIEEAKRVACEMTGQRDFAFVGKVQLAVCIGNLVIDFHRKKRYIELLHTALRAATADEALYKKLIEEINLKLAKES
jgi:hypothetical protein